MQDEIRVIICEPGKSPRLSTIKNTLEDIQRMVGGYIETYTFAEDACIICNEEGKLKGLAPCMKFLGEEFVGTCLFVGVDGPEFCDVPKPLYELLFIDIDRGRWEQDGTVLDVSGVRSSS